MCVCESTIARQNERTYNGIVAKQNICLIFYASGRWVNFCFCFVLHNVLRLLNDSFCCGSPHSPGTTDTTTNRPVYVDIFRCKPHTQSHTLPATHSCVVLEGQMCVDGLAFVLTVIKIWKQQKHRKFVLWRKYCFIWCVFFFYSKSHMQIIYNNNTKSDRILIN